MDKTQRRIAAGAVSDRARWNFTLTRRKKGTLTIAMDGKRCATLNLHRDSVQVSRLVWQSGNLADAPHALVLKAISGRLPVDCLQVRP